MGVKGILVSCFGSIVYEVFMGYFLGADIQPGRKRDCWRRTSWEGKRKGGGEYRCLCIRFNMEPLCTNFLLSFWKVHSRSEAISSVFPMLMCADVSSAGCDGLSLSDRREGVC